MAIRQLIDFLLACLAIPIGVVLWLFLFWVAVGGPIIALTN